MNELSDAERDSISSGHCPCCNYRGFVLGPQGGMATNIECGSLDCRKRFNVAMFAGRCLMGQPIPSEADGGASWPVVGGTRGHSGTFS